MIRLWLKALHIIFIVCWFAGLFYLPRLFVYHAMSTDKISVDRFKIMERKLYYGIMTPAAIITIGLGLWMLHAYTWEVYKFSIWLYLKLGLVSMLCVFHLYCGHLRKKFYQDKNNHTHTFYRWLNEVPTVILITVVFLTILKPF